ncbi:hypothetical protein GCM10009548_76540 [Streptomyces malaysiensis subsp. malaysiensis]|uniref:Uncharacterized protein n=1 Tax=Streptomyces malaysiensis TaxID=92644 RepID=A0ABX6VWY2_STRMQ|nr:MULTISPECIES: hypothetical protein [Streptomyces]QPI53863.1 hypothetical protein I1A49_02030 [Streptomyces solisilvae]UHH15228.1 hypothetical protein LUV23_02045 [Streptomyces sp. HNM0561]
MTPSLNTDVNNTVSVLVHGAGAGAGAASGAGDLYRHGFGTPPPGGYPLSGRPGPLTGRSRLAGALVR